MQLINWNSWHLPWGSRPWEGRRSRTRCASPRWQAPWSSSCTWPCSGSSRGSWDSRWWPGARGLRYLVLQKVLRETSCPSARLAFPFLQLKASISFLGRKVFLGSQAFVAWKEPIKITNSFFWVCDSYCNGSEEDEELHQENPSTSLQTLAPGGLLRRNILSHRWDHKRAA